MGEWLPYVNVRLPDLIAGTAGGIVNVFVFKQSKPWAIVGSIVVGALAAAYFTEPAVIFIGGFYKITQGATGFLIGLGGMGLCQGLAAAVEKWRPTKGGTS